MDQNYLSASAYAKLLDVKNSDIHWYMIEKGFLDEERKITEAGAKAGLTYVKWRRKLSDEELDRMAAGVEEGGVIEGYENIEYVAYPEGLINKDEL